MYHVRKYLHNNLHISILSSCYTSLVMQDSRSPFVRLRHWKYWFLVLGLCTAVSRIRDYAEKATEMQSVSKQLIYMALNVAYKNC